jgi:arylsulfatase A-like enzyme
MFGHTGSMLAGWDLEEVLPALAQKAVDYIAAPPGDAPFHKEEGRPFFLYLPLTAPHTPIAPADEFEGMSRAGRYGDFVCQVDATVGRVLKALEETGQARNTLVIFTSDNGSPCRDGTDMCGPVGSVRRFGHNPSHIFRGTKADIWDGGHRVPFIARWPGRISAGSESSETVCHADLMATCADLLETSLPDDAGEDSFSILPVLLGREAGRPLREAVVHHSINGMFAVREGSWKLILGKGSGGWSGGGKEDNAPGQLYDLESDPSETTNLYTRYPGIVRRLTSLLEKIKREGRSRPRSR